MDSESSTPIELESHHTIGHDGTRIHFEVVGKGERTVILACGVGARLYSWEPLVESLRNDFKIVSWDYRGFFGSACPESTQMAIRDHALDALRVLDAINVTSAAWVGWSMGVQVALEASAIDPKRVAGLVLINGTWGQIFSQAWQPPGMQIRALAQFEHKLVEWLRNNPTAARTVASLITHCTSVPVGALMLLIGRRAWDLKPVLDRYVSDATSPEWYATYLRHLQELDASSCYHHLPNISVPTIVINGQMDILTPWWIARELANRIPNSETLTIRKGTHFVLLEHKDIVVPAISNFLRHKVQFNTTPTGP